jgi:putative transposase
MSRKHRVWYPGATYHITARGNRRTALFEDQNDYLTYLSILEDVRSQYPFILHSYCLMTNHIHLQLETTSHHIQLIMKEMHSRYAIYFNRRHDYIGHLFQGRYGAKLIDSVAYFLDASRYIHLNPVEANIVQFPHDYRWSSYPAYITSTRNPHVFTSKILSYFPEPKQIYYQYFVERQDPLKILDGLITVDKK